MWDSLRIEIGLPGEGWTFFRNCPHDKLNIWPYFSFHWAKKCCARSKSELNYKNVQQLWPQMLQMAGWIQNPKHHPDTWIFWSSWRKLLRWTFLRVLVFRCISAPNECPQYSNSSKYTTYAHNNLRIEIPGGGCTSLPRVKPGWSFVCRPYAC